MKLTENQRSVLRSIRDHGDWSKWADWTYGGPGRTRMACIALEGRGLLERLTRVRYVSQLRQETECWRITEKGLDIMRRPGPCLKHPGPS